MEEKELKIIFENDDYLVLDKPAGIVVNRSVTAKNRTLQDMLEERGGENLSADADDEDLADFAARSGIVHRLDKDTSGVLLVAKKEDFFKHALAEFKARKVEKEYATVVHGAPEENMFEINAPIKRSPKDPMKMAIVEGGREAQTKAMKIGEKEINGNMYSFLKVYPATGRTHQIRVHLAAANLFIAGDPIYCPKNLLTLGTEAFGRMMLHASKIRFFDTQLHDFVQFESPLPTEYLPFVTKI